MALLREYTSFDNASISVNESSNGKNLSMEGIFIQADVRNHNERIYPLAEISNAVQHVMERINGGESVLGECDHPEELTINIDRVSHFITEMRMNGSNGCGKLKVLPTPTGQIIRTLIENQVKLGVSSRGSGNVDHNGVVSDFEIVTVDIVAQPSAPSAYPKAIYESLYNMRGCELLERIATDVAYNPHDYTAKKHLANNIIQLISELRKQ